MSVVDSDRRASERKVEGRGSRWRWVATAAVVLMVLGFAVVLLNSRPSASRKTAAEAAIPLQNGGLGLRIQVQGNNFLITWDRDAPAMRSATKGVLRIQDGAEHRSTELQRAELANGSIVYRPNSDDVDFLLIVYGGDGAVTREGVRALDGMSGTQAAVTEDARRVLPAAASRAAHESKSRQVRREEPKMAERPSRGEPLPRGQAITDYIAPQPLKVVMPDVARLTPESLPASGKIEVDVEVNEQGRVTAAKIPAGGPRVSAGAAKAAIAAAKQWRFEPAKLRGKSVASRHQVIFDIQPGAR